MQLDQIGRIYYFSQENELLLNGTMAQRKTKYVFTSFIIENILRRI